MREEYKKPNVCFVVYTGRDQKESFVTWLEEEGFTLKSTYGGGRPWVHVFLAEKKYIPGKLGVGFGYCVGDHAISIDDFKVIYDIYRKYQGLHFMDITGKGPDWG